MVFLVKKFGQTFGQNQFIVANIVYNEKSKFVSIIEIIFKNGFFQKI